MQKTLIINQSKDGGYFIDILREGYNIIEKTIYNEELAQNILQAINNEELAQSILQL